MTLFRIPALVLLGACAAGPEVRELAPDEVFAGSYELPDGAEEGMWQTWRIEQSDPESGDAVEETIACVARTAALVTMEWRAVHHDGTRTTTAARFRPDASLLGVWRGPTGGTGRPMRIVTEAPVDLDALEEEANRTGRGVGISTKDARRGTESAREEIDTPAGRVPCTRTTEKVSLLFVSARTSTWWADEALPLSRLVKLEMCLRPGGVEYVQVLAAHGTHGAVATLALPQGGPAVTGLAAAPGTRQD